MVRPGVCACHTVLSGAAPELGGAALVFVRVAVGRRRAVRQPQAAAVAHELGAAEQRLLERRLLVGLTAARRWAEARRRAGRGGSPLSSCGVGAIRFPGFVLDV